MKKQGNVSVIWSYIAMKIVVIASLGACASPEPSSSAKTSLPFYRCEYGIEFTAKFDGDSVALDSSRGYDLLYATGKDKKEYSNPRMAASFGQGASGREAQLRYPLLPLIAHCVRDN
jgi:hypothetical protein